MIALSMMTPGMCAHSRDNKIKYKSLNTRERKHIYRRVGTIRE